MSLVLACSAGLGYALTSSWIEGCLAMATWRIPAANWFPATAVLLLSAIAVGSPGGWRRRSRVPIRTILTVYLVIVLCLHFGLPRYGLLDDSPWYAPENRYLIVQQIGALFVVSLLVTWAISYAWPLLDRLMKQGTATATAALLLPTIVWLAAQYPPASKPDIVLINIDTLRADHLSLYGYERETTPNLTRLADSGIVYDTVYSQSCWTAPSVSSLFTGRRVDQHGCWGPHPLRRREVTVAERLQGGGYRTALVSANAIVSRLFALDQGFESTAIVDEDASNLLAEQVTDAGLRFLSKRRPGPLFLYLHYMDPHDPYFPPEPYRSAFVGTQTPPTHPANARAWDPSELFETTETGEYWLPEGEMRMLLSQYDGCIMYVDAQIGRILEFLEVSAGSRETIVIVTGDHGESFGERGVFFHGNNLNVEEVTPPLLIARLGDRRAASRDDRPAQTIDVTRTILELSGVTFPADLPGHDLLRADDMRTEDPIRIDRAWSLGDATAIIHSGMKLIYTEPDHVQLYDTAMDPLEQRDLWEQGDARTRQQGFALLNAISEMTEEAGPSSFPFGDGLDDERIEQLKALGYVDEAGQRTR